MKQFNKVVDVPVIMRLEAPQIQVIADMVDIPARNRDRFSTFSIGSDDVPELSASFSSFRALTTVSARGSRVPVSPGV